MSQSTYKLIVPVTDQKKDTHHTLSIKPSMRTKDVMQANTFGAGDNVKMSAYLIGTMTGLAYEDVLEMDIRDFDALDALLADMRFGPKDKKEPAANSGSQDSSTKS